MAPISQGWDKGAALLSQNQHPVELRSLGPVRSTERLGKNKRAWDQISSFISDK
jgi:hypothetical protein